MRKILSLLLCTYIFVGCSATHQAKVRERINDKKRTTKVEQKKN